SISFDLFGTLADPSTQAASFPRRVADPSALAASWRRHQLEISWLLTAMGRYEDWDAVSAYALSAALQEAGLDLTLAEERDVLDRAREAIALYEDVPTALMGLYDEGFELSVFSNGTRTQIERLVERTGMAGLFACLIS